MPQVAPAQLVGNGFSDWFYQSHTGCFGITDSGKSVFLKRIAQDAGHYVLVWNPEDERYPGRKARSPAEVKRLFAAGVKKVHYVPRGRETEEYRAEFEQLRRIVWEIGDSLKGNKDKAPHWLLWIIDEAHTVAPKSGKAPEVKELLTRGRKRGIHVLLADQRPANVDHTTVTQCQYYVLFRLSTYELDYMRRHGVELGDQTAYLQKDYHFIVTDGDRWCRFRPVEPI